MNKFFASLLITMAIYIFIAAFLLYQIMIGKISLGFQDKKTKEIVEPTASMIIMVVIAWIYWLPISILASRNKGDD